MNLSFSKVSTGLIAGVMALTAFSGVVSASETTTNTSISSTTNVDSTTTSQENITQETISILSPYISISPLTKQYSLDKNIDIYKLLTKTQADIALQSIAEQNSYIQEQMSNPSFLLSPIQSDKSVYYNVSDSYIANLEGLEAPSSDPLYASSSQYISGITRITYNWWGCYVYLSKYVLNTAGSASIGIVGYLVSNLALPRHLAIPTAGALGAFGYVVSNIPYGVKLRLNRTFASLPIPPYVVTSIKYQSR